MSSLEKPLVYIMLGAAGSGRRQILADLIQDGLVPDERALVLLSATESPSEEDGRFALVARWTAQEDGFITVPEDALAGASHLFFVTDGRRNPVDQIEAVKSWLESMDLELARVFCVVNCRLAEQHRELLVWYDACIHFSDVVLLTQRAGVANKWISDFQNRFKDQFFPCLFELVKDGRVKNPALILDPQPRRVSHYFDEPDWIVLDDEADDADEDDERETEGEEEVEVTQAVDPYLELRAGGRRVKELPDISRFL